VVNQFASFFVAVAFLYLRYLFKENSDLHQVVGNVGTGLSLLVMCLTVWGAFARWTDQVSKKRQLSEQIRAFVVQHHKFADARPADKKKITKWLADVEEFEDERKHELATVGGWFLRALADKGDLPSYCEALVGRTTLTWPQMLGLFGMAPAPSPVVG
jgi:hypothetical protein